MGETLYTNVIRMLWRQHAKGPGVATFDYDDGGHDHRKMSQYEARNLAQSLGLGAVQERPDIEEWVRR
jgi:hypothetical protein